MKLSPTVNYGQAFKPSWSEANLSMGRSLSEQWSSRNHGWSAEMNLNLIALSMFVEKRPAPCRKWTRKILI